MAQSATVGGDYILRWTEEERAAMLPQFKHLNTGKVREIFEVDDKSLLFVASDRLSCFDVVMKNGVPGKGKVLTQITSYWLKVLADVTYECGGKTYDIPNHLIEDDVDKMKFLTPDQREMLRGRVMHVKKLIMLPVESIARGHITGSGWKDYQKTGMVCGHKLPEGMVHAQKIETPIYTPSTKADYGDHDENITRAEAAQMMNKKFQEDYGIENVADQAEAMCLALFSAAREVAAKKGIILADTKFEFGIDTENNRITLADEVLTPDSSRYWPEEQYEAGKPKMPSYDKQYVRDWLSDIKFNKKDPMEIPNTDENPIVGNTEAKYAEIQGILTTEE